MASLGPPRLLWLGRSETLGIEKHLHMCGVIRLPWCRHKAIMRNYGIF